MTGTMTWAAMDVHARSIHAASLDVMTGELSRRRFASGALEPVVEWLAGLPAPVRACYEAGPTGYGLYRAMTLRGPVTVVLALRPDNLLDLALHQLMHDTQAETDVEREEPLPRRRRRSSARAATPTPPRACRPAG
jgi:hypothetical protein